MKKILFVTLVLIGFSAFAVNSSCKVAVKKAEKNVQQKKLQKKSCGSLLADMILFKECDI